MAEMGPTAAQDYQEIKGTALRETRASLVEKVNQDTKVHEGNLA